MSGDGVGNDDGVSVGDTKGAAVGAPVGVFVCTLLGCDDGSFVGAPVVGAFEGGDVGCAVGSLVGEGLGGGVAVGESVGVAATVIPALAQIRRTLAQSQLSRLVVGHLKSTSGGNTNSIKSCTSGWYPSSSSRDQMLPWTPFPLLGPSRFTL